MDVTDTLRDVAYITVGAGVLGFQKAQVRRRELLEEMRARRTSFETQMAEGRRSIDEWTSRLEEAVNPVVSDLQSRVDTLVEQFRTTLGRTSAA